MPRSAAGKAQPKAQPKAAPKAAAKASAKAVAKASAKAVAKAAKAPAKAKAAAKSQKEVKKARKPRGRNPLIEKRTLTYGIGGAFRRGVDLSRFVKWPKYIRLQRQKRVLLSRTKVPPSINQFSLTLDKNGASQLFRLLKKYAPETRDQKRSRLLNAAKLKAEKKEAPKTRKPNFVKCGLNHVTSLVEQKKASLVVIAHDVDPIELVLWLPALCRKKEVPYVIVKSKARLGAVVHKKTASCLAFTTVNPKDKNEFAALCSLAKETFNDNDTIRKRWGGLRFGTKSAAAQRKKLHALRIEEAKRAKI